MQQFGRQELCRRDPLRLGPPTTPRVGSRAVRFGVFYELQMPRPWTNDSEERLLAEALEQVEIADEAGIDVAWAVEHHFLEEYSHCSAPEVFLSACAARTKRIRLGHGIRQAPPAYNHPARTAE